MDRYTFSKKADFLLFKPTGIILLAAFIVSRLVFMRSDAVFFDSPEYLERFADPNLISALSAGHLPLHSGYVLILWPFFQLSDVLNLPQNVIILPQIVLSCLAIIAFYKFTATLFNNRIAFIASLIASFVPLWWIMSVTVSMEAVYIPFFIFSLYFTIKYARKEKHETRHLLAAILCYGYSFFTHFGIILWLPLLMYLVYFINKSQLSRFAVTIAGSILVFSLLNSLLISMQTGKTLSDSFVYLYTGKLHERAASALTADYVLSIIRNSILPLLRMNTILITVFGFIGLLMLFKYKKNIAILMCVWLLPIIIANQWWDSLFFGRHTLPASFGLAILSAYFIAKKPYLQAVIGAYVLITVIPALMLLRGPIPYLQLSELANEIPKDALYIESHFARPHIERAFRGNAVYVDEPGWNKEQLNKEITESLLKQKQVYISSQALSEPYALYSGPYLHTLSLSYRQPFILEDIIKNFSLRPVARVRNDIVLYRFASYSPTEYPVQKDQRFSFRRIDFTDPIIQGWKLIRELSGR